MLTAIHNWLICQQPTTTIQTSLNNCYAQFLLLLKHKSASIGMTIILLLAFIAIFAPYLAPYSPTAQILTESLQPASLQHWLGTDELGRDILSRIIFGTRYAFYIVTLVSLIAAPLGLIIGLIAGYCKGLVEQILIRTVDIFLALPRLILALAFVAALGPGINNAILAIALTAWAPYARLVRAQTLTISQCEFIDAIRLQGASHVRIIFKHILPLCLSAIIINVSLDMSGFILSVAGLGFLGLGAQPPLPEWGAMIATGREYILEQWWLITFPGLAIAIVSLGFNLLGDGLRDIFDPKHIINH